MIGLEEPVSAATVPDVGNDGIPIKAYYDPARKCYWVANARGGWIEVNETSLRRRLRDAGLGNKPHRGAALSEVDAKLIEIQDEQDVSYAGPLAGYRSGVADCCGSRILVTASSALIEPVEGEWPMLKAFFRNLLVDAHYDQRPYLYGWLKIACEALASGSIRPGQAMGLAGPRNCGKSLLQNLVITKLLGGRSAKPYRYMSGGTQFNSELFGAEHLMIEDEHSSTDVRARRALGSHIKQLTVNQEQSCHGKGLKALTLSPFWRVSISVNDEAEALMVLPPMSDSEQDSLSDKMFLLRACKAKMPMPTNGPGEREAFWKTLVGELPAFLYFLREWQIPAELRDGRFGIKTWHHPDLLSALSALAPETRLLAFIDEVLFGEEDGILSRLDRWKGTAEQLERQLFSSGFDYEAKKLLGWATATGTYLGRLAGQHPERVQEARTSSSRNWIITGPERGPG